MKRSIGLALFVLAAVSAAALGQSESTQSTDREKLAPDTPKSRILSMDPARVDPSDLPLDRVDQLHTTGSPQPVKDISTWRLAVTGKSLPGPASLGYDDLLALPMVSRRALLICPGFFADYAEWQGAPLSAVLQKAGAPADYAAVSFRAFDGYSQRFTREEADRHHLFLAVRVNGETLPVAHGYPVRLVAEDLYGGRWVKWITEIRLE